MCHVFIFTVFNLAGSGIGTGPGVIQDRFSPTLGRHRTNPLFNGHSGHMASHPQSQFDLGMKPFIKANQVSIHVFAALSLSIYIYTHKIIMRLLNNCISLGTESAFSQPKPEPFKPAASSIKGHASTLQEGAAQCRRGKPETLRAK